MFYELNSSSESQWIEIGYGSLKKLYHVNGYENTETIQLKLNIKCTFMPM